MKYHELVLFGQKMYVTDFRVQQKDRDSNLFYYEIRHSDDGWEPATIEKNVWVNHFGTLVSNKEIEFTHVDYTPLLEENAYAITESLGGGEVTQNPYGVGA